MAESNEIEFETPAEVENAKTVEENKKLEGLEARVSGIETKVTQILSAVEELKKVKAEPVKVDNTLKDAVANSDKKIETLTKKVEELEAKPARMTHNLSEDVDADKKAKEFLGKVTGGEMLVYAEKNHLKWGNGE